MDIKSSWSLIAGLSGLLSSIAISLAIASVPQTAYTDSLYVAKGTVLYEEGGERHRLIVEPGTLLRFIRGYNSFEQGQFYEVQTPTDIRGAMRARDVEVFQQAPEGLAFVRKDFTRRGIRFTAGDLHPYQRLDELDEAVFEVDKGVAKYVVRENDYQVKRVKVRLSRDDFVEHMNVMTVAQVAQTTFPLWQQVTHQGQKVSQSWGCGESSKVVDFLRAGAEAGVEVSGSFWTWVKAKFSANLKAGSDSTWTIEKKDETHQHKLTFWSLTDPQGGVLLRLVIDRISECPPANANKKNYVFSFPGNEIDSFEISHAWVQQREFRYPGYVVPLLMVDLPDLRKLEDALLRSGYLRFDADLPCTSHVRDQIVRIAAAVVPPAK